MGDIDKTYELLTKEEQIELSVISDPVKWAEATLRDPGNPYKPLILRDYQKKMLRYQAHWVVDDKGNKVLKDRIKVYRTGRRLGKTLVVSVEAVWFAFTNANYKVLIAVPYESQVRILFNFMDKLMMGSGIKPSRYVKKPFIMEFENGSTINGATLGAKSSSKGGGTRGEEADCFVKGTCVNTSRFAVRPIEKLTCGDPVMGSDGAKLGVGEVVATRMIKKDIMTISTDLNTLHCTFDHPFFDTQKDVPAEDAKDIIVSLEYQKLLFSNKAILSRLAGHNFGDGWLCLDGQCGFSGQKEDLEQIVEDIVLLGGNRNKITESYKKNSELGIEGYVAETSSAYVGWLLRDSCPIGRKVYQQLTIPEWIKNGDIFVKHEFLSGLFSAEASGINYVKNGMTPKAISFSMNSSKREWLIKWLNEVAALLSECGIRCKVVEVKEVRNLSKIDKNGKRYSGVVRVLNSKENIDKFADRIGYCYNIKKRISVNIWKLYRIYEKRWNSKTWVDNRNIRKLKYELNYVQSKISRILGLAVSQVKKNYKRYHPLYSEKRKKPMDIFNFYKWKDGFVKLPIMKTTKRNLYRKENVYNIQTSKNAGNRYIANGSLVHNCTLLDEMDHGLDDVITEIILPIFFNNPRATIIASSTPSGRRGLFWNWCNDPDIKEFHYSSFKSPNWTEEADAFARKNLSKTRYTHEVLANWGAVEEGVFRNQDLKAIQKDYHYLDTTVDGKFIPGLKYDKNNIYIMGVDWNETFGAAIVILEKIKASGKFRVFRNIRVEKSEFTQLESVQKVIDLAKVIDFLAIYVDHGYGASNDELLRKYGKDNPMTKLDKKVKAIDYGGNLEIRDPITGMKEPKPAKPYMVNNAVVVVENHLLVIPKDEDEKHGIIGQMREYKVAKFSRGTDRPVYDGGDNDHALNALFLALFGFKMEIDEKLNYHKTTIIKKINSYHIPDSIPSRGGEFDANISKLSRIISQNMPNYLAKRDVEKKNNISSVRIGMMRRNTMSPPKRQTF